LLEVEAEGRIRELSLDLAFEVEAGAPLALVGPSGSGKSTALRLVAGLTRPRRGRIVCGGSTWLDTDAGLDLAPERRRCGYVFQDYALFAHMSAWRNVAYGLDGVRGRRRRDGALELLERFGVLPLAEARPSDLSGGEQQRVALARALAARPRALLLDEPLAALDVSTRASAGRELGRLTTEAGVPTLLVTHDFVEAITLTDRVAVIEGGRIVQQGAPEKIAAQPASSFVAEVTGSSVLFGSCRRGASGLAEIALDGVGLVRSTDQAPAGPVAISVHPWEVALEPAGAALHGSQQNRLPAMVRTVTRIGSRVRVGLDVGQPLVAEVTEPALEQLQLAPGTAVTAVWKASATRAIPR